MAAQSRGELYDIGYRHYEGPREGRNRARFALWTNGMRTALGIGRGGRAKILPILLFAAITVPAVVIVMIASFAEGFGASDVAGVPGHADYYDVVSILILLFSAIIAPELLCADRRNQVLQLYLVRPLTSTDYVAGRWLAFFTIVLALVYSGQIVLFVGFTLAAEEPLTYVREKWLDVPRFLAAGAVIAVFHDDHTARRIGIHEPPGPTPRGSSSACSSYPRRSRTRLTGCTESEVVVENGEVVVGRCETVTGRWAKWIALAGSRRRSRARQRHDL